MHWRAVGEQAGKCMPARELYRKEQEKGRKKRKEKGGMVLLGLSLEIGHNSFLSPLSQLVAFFSDRKRDYSFASPPVQLQGANTA